MQDSSERKSVRSPRCLWECVYAVRSLAKKQDLLKGAKGLAELLLAVVSRRLTWLQSGERSTLRLNGH